MNNEFYIGMDIGSSSVKGVLLCGDSDAEIATAHSPFIYETDNNGKVEIGAHEYLESCMNVIRELSKKVPENGKLISICTASASGNILFLDDNFSPISKIINWQDHRTDDEVCRVLGENFDYDAYFESTGWAFDKKTFPLASLCRLKVNEPEIFEKASYLSMSTEYLYKCLTGSWGLSTSAGTPFYLIDQKTGKYRTDILSVFGLSEENVPPVVPLGTLIGKITKEASEKYGIPENVSVIAGAFDHPSAARGAGILKPGDLLLSCGTSWVGFYPVESREIAVKNKLLIDPFLSEEGGPWAGMVSLASVASRIDDYICKYVCNEGNIYEAFEKYSRQSEIGAGGLEISLSSDDNDEYIKSFEKKHIARAIMECVVKKLKVDFDRLSEGGIKTDRAIMVGGPTKCPLWIDVVEYITGIKAEVLHGEFAGAVGAAGIGRKAVKGEN